MVHRGHRIAGEEEWTRDVEVDLPVPVVPHQEILRQRRALRRRRSDRVVGIGIGEDTHGLRRGSAAGPFLGIGPVAVHRVLPGCEIRVNGGLRRPIQHFVDGQDAVGNADLVDDATPGVVAIGIAAEVPGELLVLSVTIDEVARQ